MANAGKIRTWMNNNSAIVTILAVVVLIMSLGIIVISQQRPSFEPVPVYFYDLNTGQLFPGMSSDVPPIPAPSGGLVLNNQVTERPAGVKAYVYSCTDCEDESSQFIGWLEMYTPDVKAQLENPQDFAPPADPESMEAEMAAMEAFDRGHLIGEPADNVSNIKWVPATSEEGFLLTQRVQESCGTDVIAQPCMP